jgi:hypothetical protein
MDECFPRINKSHIHKKLFTRKTEKRKHLIQVGAGKKQGWPMPLKRKNNRPLALALLFSRARLPSRGFFCFRSDHISQMFNVLKKLLLKFGYR